MNLSVLILRSLWKAQDKTYASHLHVGVQSSKILITYLASMYSNNLEPTKTKWEHEYWIRDSSYPLEIGNVWHCRKQKTELKFSYFHIREIPMDKGTLCVNMNFNTNYFLHKETWHWWTQKSPIRNSPII